MLIRKDRASGYLGFFPPLPGAGGSGRSSAVCGLCRVTELREESSPATADGASCLTRSICSNLLLDLFIFLGRKKGDSGGMRQALHCADGETGLTSQGVREGQDSDLLCSGHVYSSQLLTELLLD